MVFPLARAAFAELLAHGAHQFQLRHGTPETAQRSFDFAQVTNFLAQLHRLAPQFIFQIEIVILQFAIYVKK